MNKPPGHDSLEKALKENLDNLGLPINPDGTVDDYVLDLAAEVAGPLLPSDERNMGEIAKSLSRVAEILDPPDRPARSPESHHPLDEIREERASDHHGTYPGSDYRD